MSNGNVKTALITGASRGLGSAFAEKLAEKGYHVIAIARTVGGLEDLDDRIQQNGGTATLAPLDITNEDGLRQICRSIFDRWGKVDLLVHAAIHAAPLSPVAHVDEKSLDQSISINLRATARLIANVEPLLQASHSPRAVFFNDPVVSQKFHSAYGVSKTAQIELVRSWIEECQKIGPEIDVVTPAPMPTAVRARFYPGENRDNLARPIDEATRLIDELDL